MMKSIKSKLNSFLTSNLSSSHLAESVCLFLIIYIILFIASFLIGQILNIHFITEEHNRASVISNMFVWSATLFAPLAALLLVNSWKVQKNYDLQKEISLDFIKNLLTLESIFIAYTALLNEFQKPTSQFELNMILEQAQKYSKDYMESNDNVKKSNNLHHGLVLESEDKKLLEEVHFDTINDTFQQLCRCIGCIDDDFQYRTNTIQNEIKTLRIKFLASRDVIQSGINTLKKDLILNV